MCLLYILKAESVAFEKILGIARNIAGCQRKILVPFATNIENWDMGTRRNNGCNGKILAAVGDVTKAGKLYMSSLSTLKYAENGCWDNYYLV